MPPLVHNNDIYAMTQSTFPGGDSFTDHITVTLTTENFIDHRVIRLEPGTAIKLGRSSRSAVRNLTEATDNGLFDCPVVSRDHAELRFSAWQRQVTITDKGSLHGTSVNGRRLEGQTPFTLKSGDVIQLGDRVAKGNDAHDGVCLTFDMSTNPSPNMQSSRTIFPSRSFRVPEDSDHSDYDLESIGSDVVFERSSAKTTPEHMEKKLGSQEQPIELEPEPIELEPEDEDDEDFSPSDRVLGLHSHVAEHDSVAAIQDTYADDEIDIDGDIAKSPSPRKEHYDPVRGSQPPKQLLPAAAAPHSDIWSQPSAPRVLDSSADIAYLFPAINDSLESWPGQAKVNLFDNYSTAPTQQQSSDHPTNIVQDVEDVVDDVVEDTTSTAAVVDGPAINSPSGRMPISSMLQQKEQVVEPAPKPSVAPAKSNKNKRKAADRAEEDESQSKRAATTGADGRPASTGISRHTSSSRTGSIAKEMGKAAIYAFGGALALGTFLTSEYADQLIHYLG